MQRFLKKVTDWLRSSGVEAAVPVGGRVNKGHAGTSVVSDTVARTLLTLDRLRKLLAGDFDMHVPKRDFLHTVPASLVALVQAPLGRAQMQALSVSMWRESTLLAIQVLQVLDATLRHPEPALVLGHATVWIKGLEPEEAIVCAATLQHPPLRRLVRAWADQGFGTPFDGLDEEGRPLAF